MSGPAPDAKACSRGVSTDMSPAALERRLEKVGQLYEVWQLLRTARRVGPVATPADRVGEAPPEPFRAD